MSKNTNLSFLTDYITADITNGRIGINNASPTVAFDVVGVSKFTGASTFSRNDAANFSVTIANVFINQGNLINFQQNKAGTTINAYIGHGGDSSGNFIINNGTQALTITNAGNVGIGTISPKSYGALTIGGQTIGLSNIAVDINQAFKFNNYYSSGAGSDKTISTGYAGGLGFDNSVGALTFSTSPSSVTADGNITTTERMRITSGGIVQINNAGDAQLHINASGATGYVKYDNSSSDTWGAGIGFNIATNFELYNFSTATYGFRITRSGIYGTTVSSPRSVFVQSDGTLGGISSVRESKTNIASLDSSWLMQLNPVSFNYRKKDAEDKYTNEHYDELYYGLIAEEAELVNKEICTYNDNKLIGIEYSKLVPVLIKAVQELSAKVSLLENK